MGPYKELGHRACRQKLCSIVGRLLNYLGEVYLSKSALLILIRVDGIDKCHALSPALTNGWSRIAHKQALERCLGLIVFRENQRGVLVGSLGRLVSKDVHRWLLGQV